MTPAREVQVAKDRSDQLRALEQVIATCRLRAANAGMPSLVHILSRAQSSLSDHAAREGSLAGPPAAGLRAPRRRAVRH